MALVFTMQTNGYPDQPALPPSNLKSDEQIQFYPTYGYLDDAEPLWRFNVHGKVYEPEEDSAKRRAFFLLLHSVLGTTLEISDNPFLEQRLRPFLVDNERGKTITVRVNNQLSKAGTSGPNGHFHNTLTINAASPDGTAEESHQLRIQAVLRDGDSRSFAGTVHLISRRGLSVISDLDDTVKHSEVTDREALMRNTFLREFVAVAGMPELYSELEKSGAVFHYVSGSPWQLYGPLASFLSDHGFPSGTMHLKHFRLKDASVLQLLGSQQETKRAAIVPLLKAFPQRTFLLFGDSGEQDPEIYAQIAMENPSQIAGIFIRNVTGETADNPRMTAAFGELPAERWALFQEPAEISEPLRRIIHP